MGCCASSHEAPPTGKRRHLSPPLVEKETVKEVLSSEIPKPKAVPDNADEDQKKTAAVVGNKVEEKAVKVESAAPPCTSPETSVVSEMCSLSESVSAATVTDTRDDGRSREIRRSAGGQAAPKLPRNYRASPPRSTRGRRQPGPAASSPVRRSEPSPNRGRSESGREAGYLTPARRGGPQRDLGEVYGRRSRSPAAVARSGSGPGRSPSARKTGRPPTGRLQAMAAVESSGQAEESRRREQRDNDESLDNPLVSLECFIFL